MLSVGTALAAFQSEMAHKKREAAIQAQMRDNLLQVVRCMAFVPLSPVSGPKALLLKCSYCGGQPGVGRSCEGCGAPVDRSK